MRLGLDLGGTKTEIIALAPDGTELRRERVPTPAHSYDAILDCICGLIDRTEKALDLKGSVGIGMPGAVSPHSGLIKNANTVCLNGKPFASDLASRLGRPVRLMNDANCLALSEASDGAAAGSSLVFGVILGTGVGGGLVVNGQCLTGANAIAGEWTHNPLPWPTTQERPGPACYCGKTGCIETFVSGPGLARDHLTRTKQDLSTSEIVARASSGDPACELTLAFFEDRLARSLASVINIFDPEVIVLAGGLSNLERLYANLPLLLPRYVFSDHVSTTIRRAIHGDSSGVRGAAWLWPA